MTMLGIDASSWQSAAQVEQAMAGKHFMIHKASEGTGWKDPAHDSRVQLARSRGWLVGHYHFGHPLNSPTREGAWFLRCAAPRPGDVVALDLEKTEGTWHQRLSYARAFLTYVHEHTGASPWVYMNTTWLASLHAAASPAEWKDFTRWPLWLAYWPYSGRPGSFPKVAWPVVTCQQYADKPVTDQDILFGDAATWRALAVPAPKPPPAPPKPPAPVHLTVPVPGLAHDVTLTLKAGTK